MMLKLLKYLLAESSSAPMDESE